MTDEHLMQSIQNGEVNELGQIYERYKKPLFAFFLHLHGSAFVAEDLVQNVFERILKYKQQFKGDGNLRSWIFQIARNVSSDFFRREKRYRSDEVITGMNLVSQQPNPLEGLEFDDKKNHLHQAIAQLAEDKREVLMLVKIGEMKYREVATLLNENESTIKVKVFRAIKELREILVRQNIMSLYE
ncbi:MAG: RNA polymerase sigma factor [Saprospiraceae bacterium]|nr:RNA polymerase sigma factor [Saprospiraceae bacterium]